MLKLLILIRIKNRSEQISSKSPNIWHRLGLVWLACQFWVTPQAALAQSLSLSHATASRGDQVAVELSLKSPPGKEPLALQWNTRIPVAQVSLLNDKILLGSTAKEAGKSLNCAVKEKTAKTYTASCILSGGTTPIPNGAIATLKLRISVNAEAGAAHVWVDRVTAASKDLKQVPLPAVEAVVTIRR
jgi:hypothetical protein